MLQEQCKDQTFTSMNEALQVSCQQGLPVRVVRSYKVTSHNEVHMHETMTKSPPQCRQNLCVGCASSASN